MALTKVQSGVMEGGLTLSDSAPANTLVTTSAGNVGIGTSSPAAKLDILGSSTTTIKVKSNSGGSGNYSQLLFDTHNSFSGVGQAYIRGVSLADGNSNTGMTFGVNSSGFGAPFEAMRLDSIGNLLVGTTTSNRGRVFSVSSEAAIPSVFALASNASFTNAVLSIYAARNTTNGSYELISAGCDFVATRFRVLDNGNVQNTNSSYGGISDIKLKENIVDATPKLEDLCKVKVRSYNFKNNTEDKQIGVVAQELEEVFPGMVEELIDRDEEGNDLGTKTKAVKYSVFVPMLIKAIQEQQAIITDLKARIETLEAK
jgi:hypothetical protein